MAEITTEEVQFTFCNSDDFSNQTLPCSHVEEIEDVTNSELAPNISLANREESAKENFECILQNNIINRTDPNTTSISPRVSLEVREDAVAICETQEEFLSRLFAKETEEGQWLLRWQVPNQKDGDFLTLCYEGKLFYFLLIEGVLKT